MLIEISSVVEWDRKWVMEIFTKGLVTWLYVFLQTHQSLHLRSGLLLSVDYASIKPSLCHKPCWVLGKGGEKAGHSLTFHWPNFHQTRKWTFFKELMHARVVFFKEYMTKLSPAPCLLPSYPFSTRKLDDLLKSPPYTCPYLPKKISSTLTPIRTGFTWLY